MTLDTYERANDLMVRRQALIKIYVSVSKSQADRNTVFGNAFNPAQVGLAADAAMLQKIKAMLVTHLEEKLAELEAKFQALGGGSSESN